MKILIITSFLDKKSGWGRYSIDLINQFIKNNFDVVVVCHKKNADFKNIKQMELLPSPLNFKKNFIFSVFYLLKIIKKLKKEKINNTDTMHCFIESYAFLTFLLSSFLKVKYMITVHGTFGVLPFKHFLYGIFQKIAYKNAKNVVCVSNYTKNKISEFVKLNNLVVINNGINLENFNDNTSYVDKKENILLTVGAIKHRKGQLLSAKVFVETKKKIPNLKYFLVYSSKDKEYLDTIKNFLRKNNVLDSVLFFENISDKKLKEIYKKSKIFIMLPQSSKFNFEGFGLVYLEANAYGLPAIAMKGSGCEDAIKDGYSGFLVKDEKEAIEKIIELFSDKNKYLNFSKNAVKFTRSMTWENNSKKYIFNLKK